MSVFSLRKEMLSDIIRVFACNPDIFKVQESSLDCIHAVGRQRIQLEQVKSRQVFGETILMVMTAKFRSRQSGEAVDPHVSGQF